MHYEVSQKLRTLSLAGLVGLGAVSCGAHFAPGLPEEGSTTAAAACDNPEGIANLTDVRMIGPSKNGGFNAVNGGECTANVYDTTSRQVITGINAEAAFLVNCYDGPQPTSFQVVIDGISGSVNLSDQMQQRQQAGEFNEIPGC